MGSYGVMRTWIKYDINISTIHHWGLFLDDDKNLWVLSTDVGGSIWEKDSLTGKYNLKGNVSVDVIGAGLGKGLSPSVGVGVETTTWTFDIWSPMFFTLLPGSGR